MKPCHYLALVSCLLLIGCRPGIDSGEANGLAANLNAPFDYYINGMRTQRFSADGKPVLSLTASRATHFPADDHLELVDPDIVGLNNNATLWTVTADQGNLHHTGGKEEFTLTGAVKANTTTEQTNSISLETSKLNLWPDDKLAITDAEVVLTKQGITVKSLGMRLDLSHNTISNLTKVRGTYAP